MDNLSRFHNDISRIYERIEYYSSGNTGNHKRTDSISLEYG